MVSHDSQDEKQILTVAKAVYLHTCNPPRISCCFEDKERAASLSLQTLHGLGWGELLHTTQQLLPHLLMTSPPSHLTAQLQATEPFHIVPSLFASYLPAKFRSQFRVAGFQVSDFGAASGLHDTLIRIRRHHPLWADAVPHLVQGSLSREPRLFRGQNMCTQPPLEKPPILSWPHHDIPFLPSERHTWSVSGICVNIGLMPVSSLKY